MVNGDRIKQAREIRGFTQEELADNIGVNQSAIHQIEVGLITPSNDVLQRIVLQTKFPISFFKQSNSPEFPLGSLLFRARASITLKERGKARQYARLIYEIIEKMEKNFNKIPVRLPRLENDDPVSAAIYTRSFLGLSPDRPVSNLINTIERSGIMVLALPLHFEKQEAFSAWVGSESRRPVIVISNSSSPGDRLRFSIGHELGHLVMHQAPSGDIRRAETEANMFAGELLMPKEAMLTEIISPVTIPSLIPLKKRWLVSIQALIRRAFDLNVITQRQYTYLMSQMSAHGYRKNEPISIVAEKPRLLGQIVEMLYGNPVDYKNIAAQMNMPLEIIQNTIEAYTLKTNNNKTDFSINKNVLNFIDKNNS